MPEAEFAIKVASATLAHSTVRLRGIKALKTEVLMVLLPPLEEQFLIIPFHSDADHSTWSAQ